MTTPLDAAHAAMASAPADDALRLAFHGRLAASELYLLLAAEPVAAETLEPRIFETGSGRFALAFDRLDRLSDFAEEIAPYAALSGRALAGMLAGQGVGLALNPGVAPSSHLMAPDAIGWLAGALADAPDELEARPRQLRAPGDLPERLLLALDARLATTAGRARLAYLAGVTWATGRRGHLLAFIDAVPGAEGALARATREALVFSGLEAGAIDVTFLSAGAPAAARLARVGLRFDLPRAAGTDASAAPGMDPAKPPRLR